jgi:hypothetical protein
MPYNTSKEYMETSVSPGVVDLKSDPQFRGTFLSITLSPTGFRRMKKKIRSE